MTKIFLAETINQLSKHFDSVNLSLQLYSDYVNLNLPEKNLIKVLKYEFWNNKHFEKNIVLVHP